MLSVNMYIWTIRIPKIIRSYSGIISKKDSGNGAISRFPNYLFDYALNKSGLPSTVTVIFK